MKHSVPDDSARSARGRRPDGKTRVGFPRGAANGLALGLALAVTGFTATLPWRGNGAFSSSGAVNSEWYLYLIAIQLFAMPAIVAVCGLPVTWRGRLALTAINLEMMAVIVLVYRYEFHNVFFHAMQIGLRVTLVGLWLCAVAGPIVFWRLRQQRRRAVKTPFLLGRCWFAAVLFLGLAESASSVIAHFERVANRVVFPDLPAVPPDGELRIAAVGESTMAGFPYNGRFGIPEVVAWQLEQMYPGHKIVVENLARDGLNLHKAIRTLSDLKTRPHLLLLYSGHNEYFYDLDELWSDEEFPWEKFDAWFEWSPTFRLFDRRLLRTEAQRDLEGNYERRLVDRCIATAKTRQIRLERFRDELQQLASWCRRVEVPTLWFVPAGSEADFEPNRSFLEHQPTTAEREEIAGTANEARKLRAEGRWPDAARLYQDALDRFPGFAEFHFQLAECLVQTGDLENARRHYALALDQDGQPIRMTSPYRRQVTEVAGEFAIPIVDAGEVLRPHSKRGILDRTVFVDYVHPNLKSYYYLGMAAVNRITETGLLRAACGDPARATRVEFPQVVSSVRLSAEDLANAYRRVAEADETQRKLRYESSRLERESRQYREWSRRLHSGEISPGAEGTESLENTAENSVPVGRPGG